MPKTMDATKSHQTPLVWKPVASASISGDHLKRRIFVFQVAEECYQFCNYIVNLVRVNDGIKGASVCHLVKYCMISVPYVNPTI